MKKLFLLFLLLCTSGRAATHYIAPNGTDAGTCTTLASPCKTFAYALNSTRMAAGDTLILLNGTYTRLNSGNGTRIISPNCASGYNNGTAALPITVKAQNERQAWLQQDGTGSAIWTDGCSYWSFEGLRISSADLNINPNERLVYFSNNNGAQASNGGHISIKRCLLSFENRYRNEGLLTYELSDFALVEENELYENHRNGITMSSSNNATIRRNYLNSRNRADCTLTGCDDSSLISSVKGDHGITLYPSSNSIIENNIVESYQAGVSLEASGFNNLPTTDNKLYGNIFNGTGYGYLSNTRTTNPLYGTPTNTTFENNSAINPLIIGFYIRSSDNSIVKNNTSVAGATGNFSWDKEGASPSTTTGFTATNNIAINGLQYGFLVSGQASYALNYPDANGNVVNYSPGVPNSSTTNPLTTAPNLGTCTAWIPDASPMKRAGKDGSDIGASILYAYQDGLQTATKLWNLATGAFIGCGVVVAGVNDIAGSSCSNVQSRLNINSGGCTYPVNYSNQIPVSTGWYSIPNTTLRPNCPPNGFGGDPYQFADNCRWVTEAWNSGVLDTLRNRLIIWGGGHNNYYGNEIYSLSLNTLTMTRITNPGVPTNAGSAVANTAIANGTQPNSRHTYDAIAYMANIDKMFIFGGAVANTGGNSTRDTWLFNFATNTWEDKRNATGTIPSSAPGAVSAYDPNTGKVFLHDCTPGVGFYSYDAATNAYTLLKSESTAIDYHMVATIDTNRKRFYAFGGGQAWWWDIAAGSPYTKNTVNQTGGTAITTSVYPGVAYDSAIDRIVAWNGGDTVYIYNPISDSWTSQTFTGGPGAPSPQGTYDRWSYSQALDLFVVYNLIDNNGYTLRINTPSNDVTPPTVPSGLTANPVSTSQINLAWTASTDNVGVTGYKIFRGGPQVATSVTNSYNDTGLTPSTTYGYTVSAFDASNNNSAQSALVSATTLTPAGDTTAPSVPTNLTATALSATQINLTWTASTDNVGVTGYRIYRGGVLQTTSPTNTYLDINLTANTAYTYNVSAFDAAGNFSAQSTSASATTPPVTSTASSTFQITSTLTGTLPFTVGLAFKKGDIPGFPTLDISEFQAIVKRRWNDGSAKHAIISGQTALTANTPKTITFSNTGTAPGGTPLTSADIITANPSASVVIPGVGTVLLSDNITTPFRTWISGPEMVECHYQHIIGTAGLSVWYHVRLYKAGRVWIRAIVENGTVNATATTQAYTPTVTIGGTVVFNSAITSYPYTRWSVESWIGGNPSITPKHNAQYLIDTRLVPNYWKRNPSAAALNALFQTYIPMANAGLDPAMASTGFQAGIGLLPLWDSLYAASVDSRAYNACLTGSSSLNSYPIVWRDSTTKLIATPTNWPNYAIDGGTFGKCAGPYCWEMNHAPSEGYLAYIISGDYWHYETMAFNTSLNYLALGTGKGVGLNRQLYSQTRGTAWNLRTLSQYASVCPAGDSICSEYQTLLTNNMIYWKSVTDGLGPNRIGDFYEYDNPYGPGWVAPWQQHFFDQTLGMGSDLEPLTDMTVYNAVRDFAYKWPVGILGDSNGFYFTYASNYNIDVSTETTTLTPSLFFPSWSQVWTASVAAGFATPTYDNTLKGTSGGDPANAPTGYWGNLIPAIAYAVDHGATGAAASWSRLIGATNWSAIDGSGFDNTPIWGIVPRTDVIVQPPLLPPSNLRKTP